MSLWLSIFGFKLYPTELTSRLLYVSGFSFLSLFFSEFSTFFINRSNLYSTEAFFLGSQGHCQNLSFSLNLIYWLLFSLSLLFFCLYLFYTITICRVINILFQQLNKSVLLDSLANFSFRQVIIAIRRSIRETYFMLLIEVTVHV